MNFPKRLGKNKSMEKRLQITFSGTVQGVGFRYTTERIARRHGVRGFVRNLPDGRVEVAAEGEEAILQSFVADIQASGLKHYIREAKTDWEESRREFQVFDIRF